MAHPPATHYSARAFREAKARCQHELYKSDKWKEEKERPGGSHPYAANADSPRVSFERRIMGLGRDVPAEGEPHYSLRELQRQRRVHVMERHGRVDDGGEQPPALRPDGSFVSAAALREATQRTGGHPIQRPKEVVSVGEDMASERRDGRARSLRELQDQKRHHRSEIRNPAAHARAASPNAASAARARPSGVGRLVTL
eukprot:TRINITY_DN55598_c0_g1_i1.p3 TRINITY_DN55598_c0_g1~~TRINITY_DN55598_c0_g1_i1.p3  ORF type:complete len:229 (+),score=65.07 TRINITY_DN55598_c0_g1_i1:91-687(+)